MRPVVRSSGRPVVRSSGRPVVPVVMAVREGQRTQKPPDSLRLLTPVFRHLKATDTQIANAMHRTTTGRPDDRTTGRPDETKH
jgi:hypothetical protein